MHAYAARPVSLFRRALLLDASTTGPMALLLIVGAEALAPPTGLAPALLRGAGLVLLPFLALIAYLLRREKPAAVAAWSVIEINLVWAAASFWLLFSGQVQTTAFGTFFVLAQAFAVLGFALMQFAGWRRLNAATAGGRAGAAPANGA